MITRRSLQITTNPLSKLSTETQNVLDIADGTRLEIKTDNGTSNITVADSEGLVITITTTVGMSFGSRVITEHGIVLNDTMDDFSVQGRANYTGYEPSVANYSTFCELRQAVIC